MKLNALSNYNGDKDTRFGDCIVLYDNYSMIIYDCGHTKHFEKVKELLYSYTTITNICIIISHNDSDHTSGVVDLLGWLNDFDKYTVQIYSHQYLKHVDEILNKIDDGRRNRESLKKSLLEEFDNIKTIIETALDYGFEAIEALKGIKFHGCEIVGPTKEEFVEVAAKAVDNRESNTIGTGEAEETVMNAASVQLKCILDDTQSIILCGDASPDYLFNLEDYDIIQLPHHGQLESAKSIFEKIEDSYSKKYLVSDNTGSGKTSGGSDDLIAYMKDEKYTEAYNTKNGIIELPRNVNSDTNRSNMQRRGYLGVLDSF